MSAYDQAVADSKLLKAKPSNDELLSLYGMSHSFILWALRSIEQAWGGDGGVRNMGDGSLRYEKKLWGRRGLQFVFVYVSVSCSDVED